MKFKDLMVYHAVVKETVGRGRDMERRRLKGRSRAHEKDAQEQGRDEKSKKKHCLDRRADRRLKMVVMVMVLRRRMIER